MRGRGRYFLPTATALLITSSGCGGGGKKASEPETRAVAKQYAAALIEQRDAKAVAALAPSFPETKIRFDITLNTKDRMHVASDPILGCSKKQVEPFTLPSGGRCYSIGVRGDPVPNPAHPAYWTIRFGTLFVSVSTGEPPRVQSDSYTGGACGVKLGARSDCAHMSPIVLKALQKDSETSTVTLTPPVDLPATGMGR